MPGRTPRAPLPGSRFLSEVTAEKVRAYRLLNRLKQGDVAKGMRELRHDTWTQQTVSEVEQARRNLTIDELVGLSILLEVPMDALVDPTPVGGGDPPSLDVGWPVAMPPDMVRHWNHGAKIFVTVEKGKAQFTAAGRLAPKEVEDS